MGHAEMLLAVAGLNQLQVEGRVKVLASGDWSSFTPQERVVLGLANRLSKHPQKIRKEDIQFAVQYLGEARTLDWIYHISWCNFMTRVADAFQIPLEKENVFQPPPKPPATPPEAPPTGTTPAKDPSDQKSSVEKSTPSIPAKSFRGRRLKRTRIGARGGRHSMSIQTLRETYSIEYHGKKVAAVA